ncbi:hypothetical protein SAMN05421835_102510 [Amycolatopsis sacchari]|uniref:Uncharacterized protein n=1 Tax=Amycolatopsis sacchari TaxID=115433 RepID=A0A1I3MX94_9PSEU|nr:hypothetical protein SAMN05421835_102510 [Amycolatopsis sacchari]
MPPAAHSAAPAPPAAPAAGLRAATRLRGLPNRSAPAQGDGTAGVYRRKATERRQCLAVPVRELVDARRARGVDVVVEGPILDAQVADHRPRPLGGGAQRPAGFLHHVDQQHRALASGKVVGDHEHRVEPAVRDQCHQVRHGQAPVRGIVHHDHPTVPDFAQQRLPRRVVAEVGADERGAIASRQNSHENLLKPSRGARISGRVLRHTRIVAHGGKARRAAGPATEQLTLLRRAPTAPVRSQRQAHRHRRRPGRRPRRGTGTAANRDLPE